MACGKGRQALSHVEVSYDGERGGSAGRGDHYSARRQNYEDRVVSQKKQTGRIAAVFQSAIGRPYADWSTTGRLGNRRPVHARAEANSEGKTRYHRSRPAALHSG